MPDAVVEIGTIGGKWDNLDILDGEYLVVVKRMSKTITHIYQHITHHMA